MADRKTTDISLGCKNSGDFFFQLVRPGRTQGVMLFKLRSVKEETQLVG